MNLDSKQSLIERIRRGKLSRSKLVESHLRKAIAFQLRALRDREQWSQQHLAEAAGMTQNAISRLESPSYGKHTITTLKRMAEVFDVALVVRFVPFSQFIDWISGTPFLDSGLSTTALAVQSYSMEEVAGSYQRDESPRRQSRQLVSPREKTIPLQVLAASGSANILTPLADAARNPVFAEGFHENIGVLAYAASSNNTGQSLGLR